MASLLFVFVFRFTPCFQCISLHLDPYCSTTYVDIFIVYAQLNVVLITWNEPIKPESCGSVFLQFTASLRVQFMRFDWDDRFFADTLMCYNCIQTHTLIMPIDLRKHDPDNPITIRPDTTKAKIIKLLYQDTNLGYTPAEIRDELDLPRGTASGTLSRLHEEGLIGKTSDGLYHAFDHREDLRRFAQSLVQLDTMFTRHPEAGMDPEDVEQTGDGVKREIPDERLDEPDGPSEEPSPSEWIDTENNENGE